MTHKNWWTDPENAEMVRKLSWWNHPENMEEFPFPISIVKEGDCWVVAGNDQTKKLIGNLGNAAQGKTKEKAIAGFFEMIRFHHEFLQEQRLNFERWVPLIVGPWKSTGGRWFITFGLNVSFRYGKNMKGGWYLPFTLLNISAHSLWATYRNYLKENRK